MFERNLIGAGIQLTLRSSEVKVLEKYSQKVKSFENNIKFELNWEEANHSSNDGFDMTFSKKNVWR